jgi:hypothetical protein
MSRFPGPSPRGAAITKWWLAYMQLGRWTSLSTLGLGHGSIPLCVLSALYIREGAADKDIHDPPEGCAVLFFGDGRIMYQIAICVRTSIRSTVFFPSHSFCWPYSIDVGQGDNIRIAPNEVIGVSHWHLGSCD